MSRSRCLRSAKIGVRGIKRPWSLHGSRCPWPIHQMLPASSSRHRHRLAMQEIDRRVVIVKYLFPPVHRALRIIAILAFAARTFWRPPDPHVGLSHVRLGAACAYGAPQIFPAIPRYSRCQYAPARGGARWPVTGLCVPPTPAVTHALPWAACAASPRQRSPSRAASPSPGPGCAGLRPTGCIQRLASRWRGACGPTPARGGAMVGSSTVFMD